MFRLHPPRPRSHWDDDFDSETDDFPELLD